MEGRLIATAVVDSVNAICNTAQLCFLAWISYRLQATHNQLVRKG